MGTKNEKNRGEEKNCNLIPLVDGILDDLTKYLSIHEKIGFIYIDIVNSMGLKNKYGITVLKEIIASVERTLLNLPDSIITKNDLIAIDNYSKDCFLIFLLPPSRYFFAMEDLRLILQRILQQLNERVNQVAKLIGVKEKIEFYSGCNFIFPDPLLSTGKLIHEAHKEAVLNYRVQEFMLRFINNISHELRTPMTSIKGYVETLIDGAMLEPDTCRHFLNIINFETNRLVSLTSDLLDLSLMQGGFVEMKFQDLKINNLIIKAIMLIKDFADNKNIHIKFTPPSLEYNVMVDGDRIVQVILNILDNAVRYSSSEKDVEVAVIKLDEYLRIEIIDEGYGIPANCIPRIFEIFERVDNDRSMKGGGRGLGLAMAKSIIEMHHGILGVESEVGKGSKFYFLIPIIKNNAEDRT